MLEGIDHRAAGTVKLYRRADGSHVVGLEDIDVQPGPDYDVYVVPGADREDSTTRRASTTCAATGAPSSTTSPRSTTSATGEWTVLIWCQTFSVPIANATPV